MASLDIILSASVPLMRGLRLFGVLVVSFVLSPGWRPVLSPGRSILAAGAPVASSSVVTPAPVLSTSPVIASFSSLILMAMSFLPVGFFQGLQADLAYEVYKAIFYFFRFTRTDFHWFQAIRYHILCIQLPDLSYPFNGKGKLLIAVG